MAMRSARAKRAISGIPGRDMTDEQIAALSDEEKRAHTERFMRIVDASQQGTKREAVPLGTDEQGRPFGIIVWRKP
jgi:hypothetical protein